MNLHTIFHPENAKKIILDEYGADITLMTALISENQLDSLAYIMKQLLTNKKSGQADQNEIVKEIAKKMYNPEIADAMLSPDFQSEHWFEAVRVIDIFCCVNRMHGL